jgi:DNA polymerase III delta prime subunit
MKITKIGNKAQAKLELFKIDRRIEKKIEQHVNELGKHNTDIVEGELEQLWAKKNILVSFINS